MAAAGINAFLLFKEEANGQIKAFKFENFFFWTHIGDNFFGGGGNPVTLQRLNTGTLNMEISVELPGNSETYVHVAHRLFDKFLFVGYENEYEINKELTTNSIRNGPFLAIYNDSLELCMKLEWQQDTRRVEW